MSLYDQSFPVIIIDDIQNSDLPAIAKNIMHEVHAPSVIDAFRLNQRYFNTCRKPLASLLTKV
jgi:hypothetical protein